MFYVPQLLRVKRNISFLIIGCCAFDPMFYGLERSIVLFWSNNRVMKYDQLFSIFFFDFYLVASFLVFLISLTGLFAVRRNIIIVLMAIELVFFSSILNFAYFSIYLDDPAGQAFSLFVLTTAAAESGIGLAILILYYRLRGRILIDTINFLKG